MPRNTNLRTVLRAWAEEAGAVLAADTAAGAEVPFEVAPEPAGRRRGTPLYCYRPLTGRFIAERADALGRLPTAGPARAALARLDGLELYLRRRGVGVDGGREEAALRALLAAIHEESVEFEWSTQRFEHAYADFEATVYAGRSVVTVLAPVHGLELESDDVALGDGLRLARGDTLPDAPPEAVWDDGEGPAVLAIREHEEQPGGPDPVAAARARWDRLVRALRLFGDAAPAVGPLGWMRVDEGAWRPVATGSVGLADGCLVVPALHEDELRAFASLVARRLPRGGELAWAVERFELGLDRGAPLAALTDHLLALRALLEPEGPASGQLPARLAALCAQPEDRPVLAARAAAAAELERAVVAGLGAPGPESEVLAAEVTGHLRALLRDAVCGHLDADLRALADEILLEDAPEPAPAQA